jgi:alpha-N-arabinofuranosidase
MIHATITTKDTTAQNLTPISPLMYGGFIEYIDDVVNGPHALSAQELLNRGFDMADSQGNGYSKYWKLWKSSDTVQGRCLLRSGGYNKNGVYFQQLETKSIGKFGISQDVQLSSQSGTECYVYCRSEDFTGNIFAALASLDGKEIYSSVSLGKCTQQWQKRTAKFPLLNNIFQAQLIFYIDTIGTIEIDEASLLPDDNFWGVRNEQLDLYRKWKPTVLRFFGGCFSDLPAGRWEHSIGDIDQRPSPNFDWVSAYQRIDFGTDEYMAFCREVGAVPQLTVGFGNGTPEDAAAWVEYCNGDSSTYYGSLRAKNGHASPYKVKYWEVGNEQYGDWEVGHTTAVKYAERYIDYYRAMKKIDSTIKIMINGDLWGFKWNDTIIKVAGDYIDIFSLHNGVGYEFTPQYSKDSLYKNLMLNPFFFNWWMHAIEQRLNESGLRSQSKLAITEWIQLYGASAKQHTKESASLLSGLWNAQIFNVMLNHSSTIQLVNKTVFVGIMQSGCAASGERIIYGDPSYHVLTTLKNRLRKNTLAIDIESATYNSEVWKNVPWLNAIATYSEDTVAYSLVNTHATDSLEVTIHLPFNSLSQEMTITQVYSDDYTDANLPDEPNKIIPISWKKNIYRQSCFTSSFIFTDNIANSQKCIS